MKKVLILCLALVIAVGTVVTGTVAYLQDTDEVVNYAVVGDVEIEQLEKQRDEDGSLEDYKQEQNLFPAYPQDDNAYTPSKEFGWGNNVTAVTDAKSNLWDDAKLIGAMDKMVFVKNTGDSPCYYRTWFAFECPEGAEYGEGKEFMLNKNETDFEWETVGYAMIKETNEETGEETRYLVMTATYKDALAPDTISAPSLLQVVMTDKATNDVVRALDGKYKVLVYTQAVQTENFPNYKTALDTAFYGIKKLNEERTNYMNPWDGVFKGVVTKPADLPVAGVTHDENKVEVPIDASTKIELDSGLYTFTIPEEFDEKYADWIVDYVVSFNRDMNTAYGSTGSEEDVEVALVGQYDMFNNDYYLPIFAPVEANTEVWLLKEILTEMGYEGNFTYQMIYDYVQTFRCGVAVNPFENNSMEVGDFTITVELRMTSPDGEESYSIGDEPFEYTYTPA